jgi:hypothetical protein
MMICGSALNAETVAARVSKDGSSTTELPRIKDKISAFFILPPFNDRPIRVNVVTLLSESPLFTQTNRYVQDNKTVCSAILFS